MIRLNLIPETMHMDQVRGRHVRAWLAACGISAALFAMPLGLQSWRMKTLTGLREEHALLTGSLGRARAQLDDIRSRADEAFLQTQRARALRSKRAWSAMFGLIADAMPPGCWLISVATDPPIPPGTATRGRGAVDESSPGTVTIEAPRKMRLIGYALEDDDPFSFVTNLKMTGIFADVSLERSAVEALDGGFYFRFELLVEW